MSQEHPARHRGTAAYRDTEALSFHALTAESRFYFIRHGQSTANRAGIVQGRTESPLSARGRQQAARIGRWCRRQDINVVFSSPLQRARQTAEIISRRCRVDHTVHQLAQELDTGIFSNHTWAAVQARYPEEYRRFQQQSWEAVPQAEKISSLANRAHGYWQHLITTANAGARRIVTVTHGGMIQWLIKSTLGSTTTWMPLFPAENCAVFMLYVRPERRAPVKTAPTGGKNALMAANNTLSIYSAWKKMNFVP